MTCSLGDADFSNIPPPPRELCGELFFSTLQSFSCISRGTMPSFLFCNAPMECDDGHDKCPNRLGLEHRQHMLTQPGLNSLEVHIAMS